MAADSRLVACAMGMLLAFVFSMGVLELTRNAVKPLLLAFPDNAVGCSGKGSVLSSASAPFDRYDQQNFRQPLRVECPYHGDQHGLFRPDTPHPRYIITGGAGFIGSHLVKALRAHGVEASQLKIFDNLWSGRLANLQYPDGSWAINATADFCALDLRNEEDTMKYIRGADVIYHLADTVAGVANVFSHKHSLFHDNILINTHTLKAARENGITNYVYVGTACSLPKGLQEGSGIHALHKGQTHPAEPEFAYGWSKLMGEYEAQLAMESGVFNVGIVRFHNIYGPHSDYSKTLSQAIPSLIRNALNYPQEPYVAWGSKEQYRNFLYVDDVVRGLLLVKDRGMNKGIIQLGSQTATTIHELAINIADIVMSRHNKTIDVKFDVCEPDGDRACIAGDDRAKRLLGWEPEISLNEGLQRTIDWLDAASSKKHASVLVIVIGQARGGSYAWQSILERLIKPYNAHLATFFTDSSPQTILQGQAQYQWSIPEADDWGIYFDKAAALCRQANDEKEVLEDWRSLCDVKDQWLGGVASCDHPSSAGILLAFRWLVAQKLLSLNLLDHYDYFVMTRSDFIHLCDHVQLGGLDPSQGHVPFGEEYGGYTDRHLVGSAEMFFKMINITQQMVCDVRRFKSVQMKGHPGVNLEQTQKQMWQNLSIPIHQFNPSFFAVKRQEDPTRWSHGVRDDVISEYDGLWVKYQSEYDRARSYCNLQDPEDVRKAMEALKRTEPCQD